MKRELETVRSWADSKLRAGAVPDDSWDHHVELIEALDAVLHDIAVTESTSGSPLSQARRQFQRAANDASPRPPMRRRSGSLT